MNRSINQFWNDEKSLITFCIPTDIKVLGGVDLKTLRAIRVLRPLKLVSGVPSK